jgi:hypothetical protein
MSVPPPNNDDPSSRFSFDDPQPKQQAFGVNIPPQNQPPRRRFFDAKQERESVREQIVDEVGDALGIADRLFGCSFWLLTLPFRVVWKVIRFVSDAF